MQSALRFWQSSRQADKVGIDVAERFLLQKAKQPLSMPEQVAAKPDAVPARKTIAAAAVVRSIR
jgi:hypothetical protein